MSDIWDADYAEDRRRATAFGLFAAVAVAVAGFGFAGLTAFLAALTRREAALRRVLGATTARLTRDLTLRFTAPVLVAIPFAWAAAYAALQTWMARFAERPPTAWALFAASALAFTGLAALIAVLQAASAARTRPAEALRAD